MTESEKDHEIDQIFIYNGLSYQPRITRSGHLGIVGPFCKKGNIELGNGSSFDVTECWRCKADYSRFQGADLQTLRMIAHKIYEADVRSKYPVINFDIPPTSLTHSATEDENFFVGYKFGQEKGRKQLHIWVGEKKRDQNDKDKAQLVLDIDKEEFRHDQHNKFPGEIIADAKVIFKKSSTDVKYD